jgi:hypothetical protein
LPTEIFGHNQLYFFSQSHGITEEVKTQRLRWPGYVEGMDERVPKMLMTCEIGGEEGDRGKDAKEK